MEENKKRKIPGWVRSVILLLVLVLVLGVYMALRTYNEHQADTDEAMTEMLSVDVEKVRSFTYELDGAVYTYSREDSKSDWIYEQDPSLELEQTLVDSLLSTASEVSTDKIVAENMDRAAEFGLDMPSFTLTMVLEDGTEKTVYLGSVNSMTSDYYASVEGDGRIFTLHQDYYSSFTGAEELAKTSPELSLSDSSYPEGSE